MRVKCKHCSIKVYYLVISPVLPGVSIIIPEGAITDGVQQEIYFKVCQDNSILPPLDKEKGMILIFLHHTHDTNKVRINILFAPSSFQRTINDDEKQLYMLNTVSLLVPPPPHLCCDH